jgi:FdhD protein
MAFNSTKTINCRPIVRSQISDSNKPDLVIEEKLFTIQIAQIGSFTLLCTPTNLKELALGFIFSEGIIDSIDDVLTIDESRLNELLISLQVKNPEKVISKRNLIVTSGCGLCGKDNLENLLVEIPPCRETLAFSPNKFTALIKQMQEQQTLFKQTGAAHSAQLFDFKGKTICIDEDVGRHNALDKAIGYCLLQRIPTQGSGLLLSSTNSTCH